MGNVVNRKRSGMPRFVTAEYLNGITYCYFRRQGAKKIRLRGEPHSEEFYAHYHRILKGEPEPVELLPTTATAPALPGTFKWLCERYFEFADFIDLDDRTKHVRRQILQSIWDEPIDIKKPDGPKTAEMPFVSFVGKTIRVIRDRKTGLPEAANGRLKALRQVFTFAIAEEHTDKNPARDIPYMRSGNPDGYHTWSIEEVEQYEKRHPIGTRARLALAILLYTAQRKSDIVLFGRQHVRDGWLTFTQQKNRRNKPVTLSIPIRPELQAVLDASPLGEIVWLHNDLDRPFTAAGFGNKMRDWCDQAELPQCSAHGLRKAAATRLADDGATAYEIMSITGHKTLKQVERYTRAANQKRLAASASKLGGR